jgi:hypothetical protein
MREINYKVYTFNELSAEAQEKAVDAMTSEVGAFLAECASDDFQGSLDKLEEAFGIRVYDYNVLNTGTCFRWRWPDYSRWSELDEDPKFLIRFVDEMRDYLLKGKYYSTPFRECPKSPEHPVGLTYKYRYGKTVFNKPPFCCCLTGVYSDWAVDDAMNKCYEAVRAGHTILEFIQDMLDAFFDYWEKEIDAGYKEESVREELDANGHEFYEDGRPYKS